MSEDLLRRGAKLDRYEIRELIGQGGMGDVYRAWDEVLQRDVAVKVLSIRDEAMLKRFEREADAIGKLDNQNVVEIHDFSMKGEHPYIVMEYLRGESLADRLKGEQPLSVEEAVEIVLGVCRGVSACHRMGIIHRDLKPANVFLCETAHYGTVVKVLDFGVAKPARYVSQELTDPGKMVGTPKYAAPEQLRGQEGDELSDQYGIGLLLYILTTRESPFGQKEKKELAFAILRSDYPRPRERRPEIPEGLEAVNLKAMSAVRSARYSSVMELGRALVPYAPAEEQERWGEFFGNVVLDGEASVSGSVTRVEDVLLPGETEPTQVVAPEEVAELARRSRGDSVSDVEGIAKSPPEVHGSHCVGGVPEAPLAEEPRVVSPVPHQFSETRVDSSLVMVLREPTLTHAGGTIETKRNQKDGWRMGRGKKVFILAIVLGVAAAVGGIAALIAVGVRGGQEVGQRAWTTMVLNDEDRSREIRDGGSARGEVGSAQEEARREKGGSTAAAEENIEGKGKGEEVVVERAAEEAPKRQPVKKKVGKKKGVEYTKDGSPILF